MDSAVIKKCSIQFAIMYVERERKVTAMDLWDELDTITDDELMDDPFDGDTAIDSSFESDYYEDWDNLEMGFDPYMGCYSDDC